MTTPYSILGVPPRLLRPSRKVEYDELLSPINSPTPRVPPISVGRQKAWLRSMSSDIAQHDVIIIAGNYTDLLPQMLAFYFFKRATRSLGGQCRWVSLDRVKSPSFDVLEFPSLLVISNLAVNSIGDKLEMARDLIETYGCPKIITVGGTDPLSFATKYLHKAASVYIYLNVE